MSYKTASGIIMPDRRKPAEVDKRDPEALGCSNSRCVFHPSRESGTTGVCACPAEILTPAEQKYIRSILVKES